MTAFALSAADAPTEVDMLKGLDPLLTADILYALESMGHGDDLVLCDTNFPADSVARETVLGEVLRIGAPSSGRAAKAVLSVLPLDSFVQYPALRMEVVGNPAEVLPVAAEVQAAIDAAEGKSLPLGSIESGRALKDFDGLGFTLQHEMSFTNILTMIFNINNRSN